MNFEYFLVKTYITIVELPKTLPTKARRVAKTFLENRVQEAQQEVDTSLLNRRLASSQGQRRQRVLHIGTDTSRLLVHEHTRSANKVDRDLGTGFHRKEEPEVLVRLKGIESLLETLEP